MFRLAIDWDLYLGLNPVRRVKFFPEPNVAKRILSLDEEERLIRNAAPFLQDLIRPEHRAADRRTLLAPLV